MSFLLFANGSVWTVGATLRAVAFFFRLDFVLGFGATGLGGLLGGLSAGGGGLTGLSGKRKSGAKFLGGVGGSGDMGRGGGVIIGKLGVDGRAGLTIRGDNEKAIGELTMRGAEVLGLDTVAVAGRFFLDPGKAGLVAFRAVGSKLGSESA